MEVVIFDLDDTLVDTAILKPHRDARMWPQALAGVGATRMFDGVREMLTGLELLGVRVAIVTTSPRHYAERVLQHHSIAHEVLIGYHDAKPPKPAAAPCLAALRQLNVEAARAIGVGDAPKDAASYRAAGMRAYAAGWSPATVHDAPWNGKLVVPADVLALHPTRSGGRQGEK